MNAGSMNIRRIKTPQLCVAASVLVILFILLYTHLSPGPGNVEPAQEALAPHVASVAAIQAAGSSASKLFDTEKAEPSKPKAPPSTAALLPPLQKSSKSVTYQSFESKMIYLGEHGHKGGDLPDQAAVGAMPTQAQKYLLHSYLDNFGTVCNLTIRPGQVLHGGYRICDDIKYRPSKQCIFYSFGPGSASDVERDVARLYGCHVHLFDPKAVVGPFMQVMQIATHGVTLKGVGGKVPPQNLMTLSEIMNLLGHKDKILDIVKLDLGGAEWTVLDQLSAGKDLSKIRQLIVELHIRTDSGADAFRQHLNQLKDIESAGFKIFSTNLKEKSEKQIKDKDVYPVTRTNVYQICYVNTKLANSDVSNDAATGKEGDMDLMDTLRANSKAQGGLPDEKQLQEMSALAVHIAYNSFLDNIQAHCHRHVKLGQLVDGGYHVCDDPPYRPSKPCIAYSFGIRGDFSYDDDVAGLYGCDVYSFDPSMTDKSYKRSEKSNFYQIGLAGADHALDGHSKEENFKTPAHWKVERLADIKAMLGHTDKILDVVKIDIEGSEWPSLIDMAESGELSKIRQLLMEFHVWGGADAENIRRRIPVLRALEKAGFKTFYTWLYAGYDQIPILNGVYPVQRTITYETSFLNTKLAKL